MLKPLILSLSLLSLPSLAIDYSIRYTHIHQQVHGYLFKQPTISLGIHKDIGDFEVSGHVGKSLESKDKDLKNEITILGQLDLKYWHNDFYVSTGYIDYRTKWSDGRTGSDNDFHWGVGYRKDQWEIGFTSFYKKKHEKTYGFHIQYKF